MNPRNVNSVCLYEAPRRQRLHTPPICADGKKSFIITVDLDPVADVSDPGEGDDAVSVVFGTSVESGGAKTYNPGPIGGKLLCVQYAVADTTSSRCVWGNSTGLVTAQPVVVSSPGPIPG
ncbi:hypothetical protein AB0D14_40800 [Streptomyces sp. NPDC048484]|uniref:hypothetical protein n=1 Tax=Streptomyces sp. NPDC048484 TaxID=3155146 RepID=UPI0034391EE8